MVVFVLWRVARVEQVETPVMMEQRIKKSNCVYGVW